MKALKTLCLTLLLLLWICAASADSMPQLRILLKRPGIRDQVTLHLGCTYTIQLQTGSDLVLPAGCEIQLQVREGSIYLAYEAMNLVAGNSIRMCRSAAAENTLPTAHEGLQLQPGGNVYPGDLLFTVQGGYLQPVLTIGLEDYLLGVLPYEMNNTFPLEALKAQAVCARTYALSHADAARAYDLTDTADSQVFGGVSASNDAVTRAVQETAGVVGMVGKKYAGCYFTASNGGQTELPRTVWGAASDDGSCAQQDDPYDLENPESVVHRCTIAKDGSSLPNALQLALSEALGVDPELALDIQEITTISPVQEKKGSNRYANALSLTFSWRISDLEEYKTKTVQLPLSGSMLDALELSVSDTNRELVTVTEDKDAFILESRRYGHGVGMSQRGAQWMALAYGKNYTEILSFYYPGMRLETLVTEKAPLPTVPAALAATPGPTSTPTPRPTLMPVTTPEAPADGYLVSVQYIDDDSSLNLRDKPSSDGFIVMRLYKNQRLWVVQEIDADWVQVRTDAAEGYVMAKFLERVQ